ncbi:MAG: DNA polymerase III subunit delta [Buchnera aphidicola (Floraphis choui)]
MKIINPEQLFPIFFKNLSPYYILIGDNDFFIQESKKIIFSIAKKNGFSKFSIVQVEHHINSKYLYSHFENNNLFFKKKIVILDLSKKKITNIVQKQLSHLSTLMNSNLLLIIYKNIKEHKEEIIWFNMFKLRGTIIYCQNLTKDKLDTWIQYKIQELKINIHTDVKTLLLQFYSGNILFLYNILNILMLIWPNTIITIKKVRNFISDKAIFTIEEWINAMLIGDLNKSMRILNYFCINNYNQIILIRNLQYDLLTILMLQREKLNNNDYILKKRKVLKNRYSLFKNIANYKNFKKIHQSINLLTKIEINIKKNYEKNIWNQLKILSYIISKQD